MKWFLLLAALMLLVSCSGIRLNGVGYCKNHTRPYDLIEHWTYPGIYVRHYQCWDGFHAWGGGPCHQWTTNSFNKPK